jgi:CheY-like chemotaxis protein
MDEALGPKVLIIEDDPDISKFIRLLLGSRGHASVAAPFRNDPSRGEGVGTASKLT